MLWVPRAQHLMAGAPRTAHAPHNLSLRTSSGLNQPSTRHCLLLTWALGWYFHRVALTRDKHVSLEGRNTSGDTGEGHLSGWWN